MSDIIHLLPDSVANQIAAGEVIQRPSSVVKELVENAIDAGADSIKIVIKDAGATLVQVIDNGKGMSETDARMAFERHATSKISDAADLFALNTLGFRGEALATIAAVAQVELRTRRAEDELGTLLEISGTKIVKQENVSCSKGAIFSVRNLFFNVPARRRFLKSAKIENSHILNEFYRIALVNPDVEFSYIQDDTEIFHLPQSNIKIRIDNIFGKTQKKRLQQELLNIAVKTPIVDIQGFTGRPEFAHKNASQYFFVNGRYMRHPYFHKAVMNAYGTMLKADENPSYFIYFEIDAGAIDLNIHPTKTEIKFENEQAIWAILSAAIKEALGKFNVVPSIDFDTEGMPEIPPANRANAEIRPPQTGFNPNYNPFKSNDYTRREKYDWEKLYQDFEKTNTSLPENNFTENINENEAVQTEILEFEEKQTADFQFKNKYIVSAVKSGMLFVEQHRAQVRILYEKFLAEIENHKAPSQQVLFPEIFTVDFADLC
jgi:DNA mismatch repair protein MutL